MTEAGLAVACGGDENLQGLAEDPPRLQLVELETGASALSFSALQYSVPYTIYKYFVYDSCSPFAMLLLCSYRQVHQPEMLQHASRLFHAQQIFSQSFGPRL